MEVKKRKGKIVQSSSKSGTQEHNLPTQPTSFIGRGPEVAKIIELLADPDCRLLTLVGTGGIGKTRLAIGAATKMVDAFAYGVYFVPLQSIQSTDFLISAVADAIKLPLSGQQDPQIQLFNHLDNKEMLLVLDNFEQLLDKGGAQLLVNILKAGSSVKLLVTSREVLNLQEEWLYPIHGLPVPDNVQTQNPEIYGAVQLFVERARQVQRDFSLADESEQVIRICQLVEGMPLAIELAASWTKVLSCANIAAEIQRNINFLSTSLRDVPERHRSMEAVCEQSWQLLPAEERRVFKRMSVFRGGFRREAAQAVAGASLSGLLRLVDKSLLRREASGRYAIHELLRQYAEEQLAQTSSEEIANTRELHCTYYMAFLADRSAPYLLSLDST